LFPCPPSNTTQICSCGRAGAVMQATAPLPWRRYHDNALSPICYYGSMMLLTMLSAELCYNVCALFLCLQGYESSLLKITGKLTKNLCVSRERMCVHEARRSTPYHTSHSRMLVLYVSPPFCRVMKDHF